MKRAEKEISPCLLISGLVMESCPMTRSLVKKGDKLAVRQYNENRKLMLNQDYHGTLGGADSFSIVGDSGIGKSTSLSRAIQLISQNKLIQQENPYMTIIPCVFVQCPFDSSVRTTKLSRIKLSMKQ